MRAVPCGDFLRGWSTAPSKTKPQASPDDQFPAFGNDEPCQDGIEDPIHVAMMDAIPISAAKLLKRTLKGV